MSVFHKVQRIIREGASIHEVDEVGRNALMFAVINYHIGVVKWLLKTGGACIADTDVHGMTALYFAARYGRYSLVQWLLEEGGAKISDVVVIDSESKSIWDFIPMSSNILEQKSLLKVMVLLDDAPPNFVANLKRHHAKITSQGRQIRALRPVYMEQQHALMKATCPLPAVLQSIVVAYAAPTPEDMWTDWAQWI
jgi:ankyrin repeat protein